MSNLKENNNSVARPPESQPYYDYTIANKVSLNDARIVEEYSGILVERGLPPIFSIRHLSYLVGVETSYLMGAANKPKKFYRTFEIPKKSGGKRTIREPLPVLKSIQRWILDHILCKLPVSAAAKAYVVGRSIKDNARLHRSQPEIFITDVENFFGSFARDDVYRLFYGLGYTKEVAFALTGVCMVDGELPQGGPASGAITNAVLFSFDNEILEFCRSRGFRYSRYADDMAISGLHIDEPEVLSILASRLATFGLRLNLNKTRTLRPHHRQLVTGLVVNEKVNVPREYRRRVRQEAYYIEKYGSIGHALKRNLPSAELALNSVIGKLDHIIHVRAVTTWETAARAKLLEENKAKSSRRATRTK